MNTLTFDRSVKISTYVLLALFFLLVTGGRIDSDPAGKPILHPFPQFATYAAPVVFLLLGVVFAYQIRRKYGPLLAMLVIIVSVLCFQWVEVAVTALVQVSW